jgi:hypothetical protein
VNELDQGAALKGCALNIWAETEGSAPKGMANKLETLMSSQVSANILVSTWAHSEVFSPGDF